MSIGKILSWALLQRALHGPFPRSLFVNSCFGILDHHMLKQDTPTESAIAQVNQFRNSETYKGVSQVEDVGDGDVEYRGRNAELLARSRVF